MYGPLSFRVTSCPLLLLVWRPWFVQRCKASKTPRRSGLGPDHEGNRYGWHSSQALEMSKQTPLEFGHVQESEMAAGTSTNQKMGGELCSNALIGRLSVV